MLPVAGAVIAWRVRHPGCAPVAGAAAAVLTGGATVVLLSLSAVPAAAEVL